MNEFIDPDTEGTGAPALMRFTEDQKVQFTLPVVEVNLQGSKAWVKADPRSGHPGFLLPVDGTFRASQTQLVDQKNFWLCVEIEIPHLSAETPVDVLKWWLVPTDVVRSALERDGLTE